MVGHGGSSAGSYLADPTSPIPSHCASIVVTSALRVKNLRMSSVSEKNLEFMEFPEFQAEFENPALFMGSIICLVLLVKQNSE